MNLLKWWRKLGVRLHKLHCPHCRYLPAAQCLLVQKRLRQLRRQPLLSQRQYSKLLRLVGRK